MKQTSKRRKKSSSSDISGDLQEPSTSQQLEQTGVEERLHQSRLYKPSKKSARAEPEWIGEPSASESRTPLDYYTSTTSSNISKQAVIGTEFMANDPFEGGDQVASTSQPPLQHYIPTTTYVAHQLSNIALYQPSTSYSTGHVLSTDLERPTVITSNPQSTLEQAYYDEQSAASSYLAGTQMIGAPATSSQKSDYTLSTTPGCSSDPWQDVQWTHEDEGLIEDPFHTSYQEVEPETETFPPILDAKASKKLVLRSRLLEGSPGSLAMYQKKSGPSPSRIVEVNKKDAPPRLQAEAPSYSTYQKASHELSVNLPADFIDIEDKEEETEELTGEPTQADNFLKDLSAEVDKSQPLGVDLERLLEAAKQKGMQFLRRGLKKGKGPGAQVKSYLKECIFIEKNRRRQKLGPMEALFGVDPFRDVTQKNIFSYLAKKYPWMPKSDRPKQESTVDNLLKQEELVSRVIEAVRMKINQTMRFRMGHVLTNLADILATMKHSDTPEMMLEQQIRKETKDAPPQTTRKSFLTITNDDGSTINLALSTVVLIYWFTNQHEPIQAETPSTSQQPLYSFETDLANKKVDMKYFEQNVEAASYIANQFLNHRVVLHMLSHQTELDRIAALTEHESSAEERATQLARKRVQETLEELKRLEKEREDQIKADQAARLKEERKMQLEIEKSEKKAQKEQEKLEKQLEKERRKDEKKAREEEHKNYVKRMQTQMRIEAKESKKKQGGKRPDTS